MRVMIIGAGIGGLTLAQALHHGGIEVSVHDRDPQVGATGGYRLHLDDQACEVLRRHLSPQHYHALLASSVSRASLRRYTWADHHLRPLVTRPSDQGTDTLMIGRVPLRTLLTHGLDDRVRFGAEYVSHEVLSDGRITAHFADGSTDTADVLVGADGTRSRVAASLAGRDLANPIGFGGIAARTPLTARTRALLPDIVNDGPVLALGLKGASVFMQVHDPSGGPAIDPASCTTVPAITEAPSLVWGLSATETVLPPATVQGMTGPELVEFTLSAVRGWPPAVLELIAATDPGSAAGFRFYAADPETDLTPWPAGPVTALGDAVHAMPPTGGRAAATAIIDADHLARELFAARDGHSTIALATHRFHREMAGYAPAAIRFSMLPLRWLSRVDRLDRPGLRGLAELGLSAASAVHHFNSSLNGRAAA
jgi:salicylate hydroxylase